MQGRNTDHPYFSVIPMRKTEVLILGGGPTGLGAAHRLEELNFKDWILLEQTQQLGGLASSEIDDQGFVWDLGGHVLFSHYDYFDRLLDDLLGGKWINHEREAWILMRDRWIPYPFQNNLWRLPKEDLDTCIKGLELISEENGSSNTQNFDEWIINSFGPGIAGVFMRPYNFKVWAYPTNELTSSWIGERVAQVSTDKIISNVQSKSDDIGWGPNATFRFPESGGTGSIWRELGNRLPPGNILTERRVIEIDPNHKTVKCDNGEVFGYGKLISSIPLTTTLRSLTGHRDLKLAATSFKWSSTHIVGIGIEGTVPEILKSKCWIYFPEETVPFYRATVFSNYAPSNVPHPGKQWSLMCEISESPTKPVNHKTVLNDSIEGLTKIGLLNHDSRIVSTWSKFLPFGYPTPFIGRDEILKPVISDLQDMEIFSRGRFGGWKYEVSNQDHSLMQGVECVNHLLLGEDELTYFFPSKINSQGKTA